jgi:hypothetical protein
MISKKKGSAKNGAQIALPTLPQKKRAKKKRKKEKRETKRRQER